MEEIEKQINHTIGKLNIVLLGPPGSGKGTQADLMEKRFSFYHFSTGEMFRFAIRQDTQLGRTVEEIIKKGKLVPDDILYRLVKEKIAQLNINNQGILFDGYPRTLVQAQHLDEIMAEYSLELDAALFLDLDEENLVKRLSGRLYCPQCEETYNIYSKPPLYNYKCDNCGEKLSSRSEDTPEAIRGRLKIYRELSYPLVSYYQKQDKLWQISGADTVGEVFLRICNLLKEIASKNVNR